MLHCSSAAPPRHQEEEEEKEEEEGEITIRRCLQDIRTCLGPVFIAMAGCVLIILGAAPCRRHEKPAVDDALREARLAPAGSMADDVLTLTVAGPTQCNAEAEGL
jgi:hypothetical protein